MVLKIGQITNADLYINGVDCKGRVEEFSLDDVASTEVEHNALGMVAVLKLPARPVGAVAGKIKFEWLDAEIERELLNPTKAHHIQLHSYVDVFDAEGLSVDKSHTLVTHLGFQVLGRGGFSAKLGEMVGTEHSITIPSFTQKIYGDAKPIIELDAFNNVYNVNGEPVWPT